MVLPTAGSRVTTPERLTMTLYAPAYPSVPFTSRRSATSACSTFAVDNASPGVAVGAGRAVPFVVTRMTPHPAAPVTARASTVTSTVRPRLPPDRRRSVVGGAAGGVVELTDVGTSSTCRSCRSSSGWFPESCRSCSMRPCTRSSSLAGDRQAARGSCGWQASNWVWYRSLPEGPPSRDGRVKLPSAFGSGQSEMPF